MPVPMSALELLTYLKPGDLVEIEGENYNRWAMYAFPGHVYFVKNQSDSASEAKISLDQLVNVAGESLVWKNNHVRSAQRRGLRARSDEEALLEASMQVNDYVHYNLFRKNSEYYCTKWKYGVGFSDQVERGTSVVNCNDGPVLGTSKVMNWNSTKPGALLVHTLCLEDDDDMLHHYESIPNRADETTENMFGPYLTAKTSVCDQCVLM